MLAARAKVSFVGDFVMAAALLVATGLVVLLMVREFSAQPARSGTDTSSLAETASPTVPPDAVAVPSLALGDGFELAVGASADTIALVDRAAIRIATAVEAGPTGNRQIMSYDLGGTRFIVAVEPFEVNGAARISGIYLR